MITVYRPDVLDAFSEQYGFDNARCGFMAFIPHSVRAGSEAYIEIEHGPAKSGSSRSRRRDLAVCALFGMFSKKAYVQIGAVPAVFDSGDWARGRNAGTNPSGPAPAG